MKFGLFYQLPCADWQSSYQRYQDTLEQIRLGDELGFDRAWLAELHFNSRFSITPSPLMLAAAAAERTRRIRLGVAVNLLPLHHPIRLAEDIATLDLLSNGRAEFGVGRGAMAAHFRGFGIPLEENRERFIEGLDFVLKAWTHEEFSFDGKYYQAKDLHLAPRPLQRPHPPVRIASNSDDTFDLVGQLGHNMFATPVIVPMPRLREGVKRYRQRLVAGGHPIHGEELALAVPIHVSRDGKEACSLPQASVMNYIGSLRAHQEAAAAQQPAALSRRSVETRSRFMEMTYDRWCEEIAIYGDPDQCVEKLKALQGEFRPGEIICWFETGGLIEAGKIMEAMRLFAREVMPYFL
jgi:alkanesulfonate monooxygenase SsuD/methylene tetrahydromethanopterin reductase-like flavin-dependent oxidoreductase (luciferase family)